MPRARRRWRARALWHGARRSVRARRGSESGNGWGRFSQGRSRGGVGGSSVGAWDSTAEVVTSLGEVFCHGLAVNPGKPTLLATCTGVPLIDLPGNPLSALVVFRLPEGHPRAATLPPAGPSSSTGSGVGGHPGGGVSRDRDLPRLTHADLAARPGPCGLDGPSWPVVVGVARLGSGS